MANESEKDKKDKGDICPKKFKFRPKLNLILSKFFFNFSTFSSHFVQKFNEFSTHTKKTKIVL